MKECLTEVEKTMTTEAQTEHHPVSDVVDLDKINTDEPLIDTIEMSQSLAYEATVPEYEPTVTGVTTKDMNTSWDEPDSTIFHTSPSPQRLIDTETSYDEIPANITSPPNKT